MTRCKCNYAGSQMHKRGYSRGCLVSTRAFWTRARNPRFYFVHAGTKPRFLTQNGHQKSGIPCSVLDPTWLHLGKCDFFIRHKLVSGDLVFTCTCHARGTILKSFRWRGHARRTDARRMRVLGERKHGDMQLRNEQYLQCITTCAPDYFRAKWIPCSGLNNYEIASKG